MIEGRDGHDLALAQPLDQQPVVVEAGRVRRAATVGLHARPRDREAVRADAELAQQAQVLVEAVVGVARDVAGVAAADLARACD